MKYEEKEFEGVLFNTEGLFFRYGKWKSGCVNRKGYKLVWLNGKNHRVHRVIAQLFIPNDDPKFTQVDHISRDRSDNRVENLRWVDNRTNSQNRSDQSVYGVGIYFIKGMKKPFNVRIRINGKKKSFGYHQTVLEAKAKRNKVLTENGLPIPD